MSEKNISVIETCSRLLGYKPHEEASLPRVDCEARIKAEKGKNKKTEVEDEVGSQADSSSAEDSESESENDEPKKKEKKSKDKVGFRDRKVNDLVSKLD